MNFKVASLFLIVVAFTSAANNLNAADIDRAQMVVMQMNQVLVALNGFRQDLSSPLVFSQLFNVDASALANTLANLTPSQSDVEFVASVSDAVLQLQALADQTATDADNVAFANFSNVRVAVLNFRTSIEESSDNLIAVANNAFGNLRAPVLAAISALFNFVQNNVALSAEDLASRLVVAVKQDAYSLQVAVQNANLRFRNLVAQDQAILRAENNSGFTMAN